MLVGIAAAYDCVKAFSETDFTAGLVTGEVAVRAATPPDSTQQTRAERVQTDAAEVERSPVEPRE